MPGTLAAGPHTTSGELPAEILAAANRRWHVFPILTQSRHASLAASLIAQATRDLDQLTRWAAEYVGCNWAAATGEASGIFVLAFDRLSAQRAWLHSALKNHDEDHYDSRIEQTLTSVAGRSETAMRFSYFRWPARRRTRKLRLHNVPGTHLHIEDDFVLIPPSTDRNGIACVYVNPDASVLPAPPWLIDIAFEPEDGDG